MIKGASECIKENSSIKLKRKKLYQYILFDSYTLKKKQLFKRLKEVKLAQKNLHDESESKTFFELSTVSYSLKIIKNKFDFEIT